jgi:CDP-glucose 4,6-dehydratase
MENLVSFSPDFWRGKRVFMTGHTGFKGSWLSIWLKMWGAELTGFALTPPTDPSLFMVANVANGMNSIIGDIRDLERLKSEMLRADPEIIIHMAAQPLVRLSYLEPVETFSTNVMGTIHVLEAARALKNLKVILSVTSDKCYENKERAFGYAENDMLGGYDPYSNSKACAELVTSSYRNSFFNPSEYSKHGVGVASGRAGNVIGGGDWAADRLIPDIFRSVEKREKVKIRNPRSTRPWQHVLEPLSGYLYLCEAVYKNGQSNSEAFNFGPSEDDVREVEWIVQEILRLNPKAAMKFKRQS